MCDNNYVKVLVSRQRWKGEGRCYYHKNPVTGKYNPYGIGYVTCQAGNLETYRAISKKPELSQALTAIARREL